MNTPTPEPQNSEELVLRLQWNFPQSQFMRSQARYVNFEGAIRSGKTTPLVWKSITWCQENPGIWGLLTRWTEDSLDTQLKPRFWELCPKELLTEKPWNSREEYVAFANGSRLYLRSMKPSEGSARYAKIAGLTLAFVGVDQAEEIPEDFYAYLQGRLSQPGFPQQLCMTPNPPPYDHWLSEEFPEEGPQKPDHEFIQTSTYDNKRHLGDKYLRDLELAYPIGHPMRRRLLEGQRGLTAEGKPVYGQQVFRSSLHISEIEVLPSVPILEAWDFGHRHPAVLWSQFTPWMAWWVHMELMGKNEYLESFIPQALQHRAQLLGEGQEVFVCCDPSGADSSSHGSRRTAVEILGEYDIHPTFVRGSNRANKRDFAIQNIARFMLRLTPNGPAFLVHPRCAIFIDGCHGGYVYTQHLAQTNSTIRRPLKDGYFDHLQNCAEYTILNFFMGETPTERMLQAERKRPYALRRVVQGERDVDESDWQPTRKRPFDRAGY